MKLFDIIHCDLDGVIADWYTGAIEAHLKNGHVFQNGVRLGEANPLFMAKQLSAPYSWNPKGASIQKYIGIMEYDAFWKPINRDPSFNILLPIYPWWKELLTMLYQYAFDVRIVTHCASPNPGKEISNKHEWLARKGVLKAFPKLEIMLMRTKWELSAPDRLLIDDHERNVDAYTNGKHRRTNLPLGGKAILFPQPWNSAHELGPINDRQYRHVLDYVESQIQTLGCKYADLNIA